MSADELVFRPSGLPPRAEPATSPDGVDLTAIRRTLALTPSERLRELEEFERALADLRARERWTSERS